MNKLFKPLSFVFLIMLAATACSGQVVEAKSVEQPASIAPNYQSLVGKSLGSKNVVDFIADNGCTSANQYQLCGSTGIALGMDRDQTVKTVFIFPSGANGFAAFYGELPLNLTWKDNMAAAKQKIGASADATFLEEAGLPNESGTPDNIRLWVAYKELGVTLVYNTLSADDNSATIHAILITR